MSYSEYNDEQLMLLIGKSDKEAFSVLYDRYSKKMTQFFFRMLNNDLNKAQDFTHDLFVKLIEKPNAFDSNKKFSSWLYSIAMNMIKNEYRKMSIRKKQENTEIDEKEYEIVMVFDKMDYKSFEDKLNGILEKIDENQRLVFIMRFQQELSLKEISEITGVPLGTVKSRLFYTIKLLSDKLKMFNPKLN